MSRKAKRETTDWYSALTEYLFFLRNGGYDRLAFTLCTVDTDTPVSFAISLMEFFPFLGCKISPFYCLIRTI